jgi:hypothetical protein
MLAKQQESGADIVVCGWCTVDSDSEEVIMRYLYHPSEQLDLDWRWSLGIGIWIKLIRRTIFITNDIKMPNCLEEDGAIHYYLMTKAKEVAIVEKALYRYRHNRPGSLMNCNSYERQIDSDAQYLIYCWELFIRDGIFEQHKERLLKMAAWHTKFRYSRIYKNPDYAKAWLANFLSVIQAYFAEAADCLALETYIKGIYGFDGETLTKELSSKKVVLFGAGQSGEQILEHLLCHGVEVAYFVDNSPNVSNVRAYPVYTPKILLDEERDALRIIITPRRAAYDQIKTQLDDMGLAAAVLC